MDFLFFGMSVLVLLFLFIVGFPFFLLTKKLINNGKGFEYFFLLVPNIGLLVILWFSTVFAKLNISQNVCFIMLSIFGLIFMVFRRKRFCTEVSSGRVSIFVVLLVFLSIVVNSLDIFKVGWGNYFPITNGDTFSYLGHVDQISRSGGEYEDIVYPSGLIPFYHHAVSLRTAVVSLVSFLSVPVSFEGHQMFFLTIRLTFPLVLLCILFVFLNAGVSGRAVFLGTLVLVGSGFGLHSVFQQFFSASIGIVVFWLLLVCALMLAGDVFNKYMWLCVGITFGILGLCSIEMFFVLLPFMLVMFVLFFIKYDIRGNFYILYSFVFGVIVGLLPIVKDLWSILLSQINNGMGNHPGNWIARTGFLVQFFGIKVYLGEEVLLGLRILVVSVFFLYMFSMLVLLRMFFRMKGGFRYRALILFLINAYYLLLSVFLFFLRRGYALLKVSDYFSFLQLFTIIISLVVFYGFWSREKRVVNILWWTILIIYSGVAFSEKLKTEKSYSRMLINSPLVDQTKDDFEDFLEKTVDGNFAIDASSEASDKIMYILRDYPVNLFSLLRSDRFGRTENLLPNYVIGVNNGAGVTDINQKNDQILAAGGALVLKKIDKYVFIDGKNGNWLGAECSDGNSCFQWLSGEGKLKFFLNKPGMYKVHFSVACGPDWAENELLFEGGGDTQKIELFCDDGKNDFVIPFMAEGMVSDVSVLVAGEKKGIRQVSVSDLYIE